MSKHGGRFGAIVAAGALAGLALVPAAAPAQQADGRWLAWVGCWETLDAPADAGLVCVHPAAGGVELVTVVGDEVVETRTLRADGLERRSAADGCAVTESAEFSPTGKRVYITSREACGGDQERATSSLFAMTPGGEWLDIRSVTLGGQSAAWVTRYRAVSPARVAAAGIEDPLEGRATAVRSARMAAGTPLTVDDLIEASAALESEVVKTLVAEIGAPLRLDAEGLVRLADAGVASEVIDVAVAVSYPERFQVANYDRRDDDRWRSAHRSPWRSWGYGGIGWGFGYPYYYDPFYYDPFYYGYGRYSRFGYGYGGYWGYRQPTVIVVTPRGDDADRSRGRVVKGRGWTRNTGTSSGSTLPRVGSDRPASTGSAATRSSGSSGSTERKAKPRGGGGGS